MKVFHLLVNSRIKERLEIILPSYADGDIMVVSPDVEIMNAFDAILKKQLVAKEDAQEDLKEMADRLKTLSQNEHFARAVEETFEKIYVTLHQGMTLSFRDNSLNIYLRSFIVNLCALSVASYIDNSEFVDGRMVVLCESNNGIPVVDWKLTETAVSSLKKHKKIIIAGAYGRKVSGETVDLGRRGSELTANIVGAVLKANPVMFYVENYNYSGSETLTYEEASQRFSGGVPIYPPAMLPAKKAGLVLDIINCLDGKTLLEITSLTEERIVKGITGVVVSGPMSLFTVYGTGLLGSIGISSAIFGVLAESGLNIHFISQSLSEYSISFAVKRKKEEDAINAVRTLISDTRQANFNDISFNVVPVGIVSVFGQGMRNVPGISGRVYTALGQAGINVIAASQGGEELSISIVVAEKDMPLAGKILDNLK